MTAHIVQFLLRLVFNIFTALLMFQEYNVALAMLTLGVLTYLGDVADKEIK